jgi:hypothetical protein
VSHSEAKAVIPPHNGIEIPIKYIYIYIYILSLELGDVCGPGCSYLLPKLTSSTVSLY